MMKSGKVIPINYDDGKQVIFQEGKVRKAKKIHTRKMTDKK